MTSWFLATGPESIVSIVRIGKLSAFIKPAIMICYNKIDEIIFSLITSKHETFVLALHIPQAPLDAHLCASHSSTDCLKMHQIRPEWIYKIFVYSRKSAAFLKRLFNNQCPKLIEVKPELYSLISPLITEEPSEEIVDKNSLRQISLKQGDLLASSMQTIVNAVNCFGIMGKGIALQFKHQYPAMFEDYKNRCQRKEVKLGEPYLYKVNSNRWILNFPTKNHWKERSKIEHVEAGLIYLAKYAANWGITSMAIPALGCGNGGLDWNTVYPIMRKHLDPLQISLAIHLPFNDTRAAGSIREQSDVVTEYTF